MEKYRRHSGKGEVEFYYTISYEKIPRMTKLGRAIHMILLLYKNTFGNSYRLSNDKLKS